MSVEVKIDKSAIRDLMGSEGVERALQIIGQVGEASAKNNAPVDTGTLRRSITYELGQRGLDRYVRIGTNIFYAAFQELGTRRNPAHPYLRPALGDIAVFLRGRS